MDATFDSPGDIAWVDYQSLLEGRHGNPFAILGVHHVSGRRVLRVFMPGAKCVEVVTTRRATRMIECAPGYFEIDVARRAIFKLRVDWGDVVESFHDPYCFGTIVSDHDIWLFAEGKLRNFADCLGATPRHIENVAGVAFVVWAPNAASVSVVGDFNCWDFRRHPMRRRSEAGLWELFVPAVNIGQCYKFAIHTPEGVLLPYKADPVARQAERPPRTASVIAPPFEFAWKDSAWIEQRDQHNSLAAPISIYEVHVEAWLRYHGGPDASWRQASDRLIAYAHDMGFTHLELLPIAEYPFGGSWGYQPLSLFAPTSRLGDAQEFASFVDRAHAAGLGVIVDWVPGHFPDDAHGLAKFDGTALYEHEDPRQGFHQDWNTLIYNYGRREVRAFLIASALYWIEQLHIDGLRVDAVASMLYRDYSREAGEWIPNELGGRENFEAIAFLRELNAEVARRAPGVVTIAEESTAWPGVTTPVADGGLGFAFKWNMGWMNDTLRYFARDPIHRRFHLQDISFGLHYAFNEAFLLPLSHDEVVHGKKSLLSKMPGDEWRRFANLRLLFALMWSHPGKKLLFMGGEFGAEKEFDVDAPFPWPDEADHFRRGLMRLVQDLNHVYRTIAALHQLDRDAAGFEWLVMHDPETSVFAFLRRDGEGRHVVCICNTTPVPRSDFEVGAPLGGVYRELFNSDAREYGGSGVGNLGALAAAPEPLHGHPNKLRVIAPPLACVMLAPLDA